MDKASIIVEDTRKIVELLGACAEQKTVFEAVDTQQNLYSLGLVEIGDKGLAETKTRFHHSGKAIYGRFKPLQNGPSEMRIGCDYAFCFHRLETVYAFYAKLLAADPDRFHLTYLLENRLYRHAFRKFTRMTIDSLDRVSVQIGNKAYRPINLSLGGVGIIVHEPDIFQLGRQLPVRLISDNQVLESTGCVRHVAPLSDEGYVCGVSLNYHDKKSIEHLRQFIDQTRQNRKYLCRMNLLLR